MTKTIRRGAPIRLGKMPVGNDHAGWHRYYAKCYDMRAKQGDFVNMNHCAWLAMYYQLLVLRDGGKV